MAGQIDLGKVVGTDGQGVPAGGSTGQALVKQSNSDYDTTWQKLNTAMPESIAIVANGNTHGAITSGQYVYVRGHATLAEGLYTAMSAIAANDTLSASNLSAVSGGGLNDAKSRIMWGEASTPSDHPHYIDVNRGSYNNIIACIKSNASYNICAYPYSGSAFRVIIRSPDGSLPSDPVAITFALFK